MRTILVVLIIAFSSAISYSIPYVIEGHQKAKITIAKVENSDGTRGGGRGIVISDPPPHTK